MKIAVQLPNRAFLAGDRTLHRWANVFIDSFVDAEVNIDEAKEYKGEAVVCLNGRPDLIRNCPPAEFRGLKACHIMDHSFNAKQAAKNMIDNNVHLALGYAQHDVLDPFFRKEYASYAEKIISVPFGFDYRFVNKVPFSQRKKKCVGLGAVNLVNEGISDLKDYVACFGKYHKWTHEWRHTLREAHSRGELGVLMDSLFPAEDEYKKFDYNIVEVYNDYQMFTTCESVMNYPSVKTYEGMACGSVFVGNQNACYSAIGLVNGKNCILHNPNCVKSFKEAIQWAKQSPRNLEEIAKNGQEWVEKNFTPKAIAEKLYRDLCKAHEALNTFTL